ncbi:MAG: hypothetical protein PHU23_07830, partial [Dehalococcoidales bacterium]|nr:hypothetical protein [Dehalococcoidales bacterium]
TFLKSRVSWRRWLTWQKSGSSNTWGADIRTILVQSISPSPVMLEAPLPSFSHDRIIKDCRHPSPVTLEASRGIP